jgi:hypothetical protein
MGFGVIHGTGGSGSSRSDALSNLQVTGLSGRYEYERAEVQIRWNATNDIKSLFGNEMNYKFIVTITSPTGKWSRPGFWFTSNTVCNQPLFLEAGQYEVGVMAIDEKGKLAELKQSFTVSPAVNVETTLYCTYELANPVLLKSNQGDFMVQRSYPCRIFVNGQEMSIPWYFDEQYEIVDECELKSDGDGYIGSVSGIIESISLKMDFNEMISFFQKTAGYVPMLLILDEQGNPVDGLWTIGIIDDDNASTVTMEPYHPICGNIYIAGFDEQLTIYGNTEQEETTERPTEWY